MALGCILAATLTPASGPPGTEFFKCFLCGDRGIADAIVNVILFAPLGAMLALNGRTGLRPVIAAGILSCCVELAQIVIPGRDPSLGDVCFNTLGAAVGQSLFFLAARLIHPGGRLAARLSAAAAAGATVVFAVTGILLAPTFPSPPYYSWWTADRPDKAWYPGRVLAAWLGSLSLRPTGQPLPPQARALLIAGTQLRIDVAAGPRPSSLAPLVVVEDRHRHDVLLIGPDRDDLVLTYRARSAQVYLDQPDVRLRGALASVLDTDTLHILARPDSVGYCLTVNRVSRCHLWFTVGRGWALLMYPRHFPDWMQHLLDAGWVAGLLFPVGLWMRPRLESVLAAGLTVAGLAVLPHTVGLSPTAPREWMGAGCGLLLGAALHAAARRHRKTAEPR